MSEDDDLFGEDFGQDSAAAEPKRDGTGRRRAAPRRRLRPGGCLAVLLALAVILGGGYFALDRGIGLLKDKLAAPEDYPGPGTGQVLVQVNEGATGTAIGQELKNQGVVASVDAFVNEFRKNPDAMGVQVGFYQFRKEMKAVDAVNVLADPTNLIQSRVTVPEGSRVRDIIKAISENTDITPAAIRQALRAPNAIGLPAAAQGNPEGYLFPATYLVTPRMTAAQLLKQMVAKTVATEQQLQLPTKARQLGISAEDVLTIASILEYEANRVEDYPKVARVIYNRLELGMPLGLDSTITYISGREGDVWTTQEERESDSEYNTYTNVGLPPGPIGSPGLATIRAALNPTPGEWKYFLPNYEKGVTEFFVDDGPERQRALEALRAYCRTHEEC